MKLTLTFLALVTASLALADREIQVPKGRRLTTNEWKAEILGVSGEKDRTFWLGSGFLKSFDAELTLETKDQYSRAVSFNVSYNVAPPLVDISPGISFGIIDGLNRTENGRTVYLATTFRYGNDGIFNQDVPTDLTIGFWSRSSGLLFFAANLPFSKHFALLAEQDSKRLGAGFQFKPLRGLTLKAIFESGVTRFGLTLNSKY